MAVDDNNTISLLHMDGADESTTFTDESGKSWAAFNQARLDTAEKKFGTTSLLCDGSADLIYRDQTPGDADFAFGAGDFTIDLQIRLSALGVAQVVWDFRPSTVDGAYPMLYVGAGNGLNYFVNTAGQIVGATALETGRWYHVELARGGGQTKLFLDGVQEGSTYADAVSYLNGAYRPTIGGSGNTPADNAFFGWIDEVRFSKVARHTANFSPPTAPYGLVRPNAIWFM